MTPIGTFNQRMSIAVGAARCMVHSVYNAASEYYKLHRKLDVIEVTTLYKIRSWNVYPGAYIITLLHIVQFKQHRRMEFSK